ncbi:MAG: hypothetical protein Q8L79_02905 [Methylobacter sp.]|uniref:cupin domain-containing protein n=1 Tax=Methylobacter sp. TaxID=2051955 RepID=UPI002730D537|nr:hypothetical protein [Methylobacter sp.]MDP1664049.1 hypothetical protein [Methylobacter sp.]
MSLIGNKDKQSVIAGGHRYAPPKISGVHFYELGNVLTRSGSLMELFRNDWLHFDIKVSQINWVQLNPDGLTDWHCHSKQTDHLVGVGGNIKLALWDGRPDSPTKGASEIIRFGATRPIIVVVPPGVWHGLRNESGVYAGYINVINELYNYESPDNFRLPSRTSEIPDIL